MPRDRFLVRKTSGLQSLQLLSLPSRQGILLTNVKIIEGPQARAQTTARNKGQSAICAANCLTLCCRGCFWHNAIRADVAYARAHRGGLRGVWHKEVTRTLIISFVFPKI